MKELKLYRCPLCGNLFCVAEDSGVTPICCGEPMTELAANSVDAVVEKHIPVILRRDTQVEVTVGKANHPMTEEHYIKWIVLLTDMGMYMCELTPREEPYAVFHLRPGENLLAAYAYCNLHGLWIKAA